MHGTVRCAKCNTGMSTSICPKCGHIKCYISIYWNGQQYKFRRDLDNMVFDFSHAERQLNVMRADIDRKTFNPNDWLPGKVKERHFEHMVNRWLNQKIGEEKAGELSPETVRHYRSYINIYFIPFFRKWDVRQIRFEQLEEFKDSLSLDLKIKTRRNILNALHSFWVWLKKKGIIKEIPAWPEIKGDDAKPRKAINYKDQVNALKRIPERYKDIIEFGFETGLRPGELCALKVKDFYLKDKQALIQRSWSCNKLRETTKGYNKQYIPLSNRALEIATRNIVNKEPDEFLFINSKTNKHFNRDGIWSVWNKYSGLNITFYEASRHSFATQVIESGVNVLQAKALLRHSDIRSTEKYFHANIKKLRSVVNNRGKSKSKKTG